MPEFTFTGRGVRAAIRRDRRVYARKESRDAVNLEEIREIIALASEPNCMGII